MPLIAALAVMSGTVASQASTSGSAPASCVPAPTSTIGATQYALCLDGPRKLTSVDPRRHASVTLPPGTRSDEHAPSFFTFRLQATIRVGAGGGAGALAVTINDRVVSQVNVRREGNVATAFYSGFVTGPVTIPVRGDEVVIDYENYVQFGSVQPGANRIDFFVESYRSTPFVTAVTLGAATGLINTNQEPYQLALAVPSKAITVRRGEQFSIPFRVTYRGQRGSRAATTVVNVLKGSGVHVTVEPGMFAHLTATQQGRLVGTASHLGQVDLRLTVRAGLNDPDAVVRLVVTEEGGGGGGWTTTMTLLTLAPLPVALVLALRHRRARRVLRST